MGGSNRLPPPLTQLKKLHDIHNSHLEEVHPKEALVAMDSIIKRVTVTKLFGPQVDGLLSQS
jgi:hypothetical protein